MYQAEIVHHPESIISPHLHLSFLTYLCRFVLQSQSELLIGAVHEGLDPARSIDELGGGDDVLRATVLHLRKEAQGGDLGVSHPSKEEHQRGPVLTLLT